MPGGASEAIPVDLRDAERVDHDDHHLAGAAQPGQLRGLGGHGEGLEAAEQGVEPQVLGQPAVEEVEVGAGLGVGGAAPGPGQLGRAPLRLGPPGRGVGGGHPGRLHVAAAPGPVLKRDGGEQRRQRRRGGHRSTQRHLRQVGADEVELVLRVGEVGAGGDVGGLDQEEGAAGALEIAVGGAVEDRLVVELGEEVGLAEGAGGEAEPVARRENRAGQLALEVPGEDLLLELVEGLLAAQGVVGGRERAARHRRGITSTSSSSRRVAPCTGTSVRRSSSSVP